MGSRFSAPGPREKRFAAYMQGLPDAAGHADRSQAAEELLRGVAFAGRAQEYRANGRAPGARRCSTHSPVTPPPGGRRTVGRSGDVGAGATSGAPSDAEVRSG